MTQKPNVKAYSLQQVWSIHFLDRLQSLLSHYHLIQEPINYYLILILNNDLSRDMAKKHNFSMFFAEAESEISKPSMMDMAIVLVNLCERSAIVKFLTFSHT